MTVKEKVESFLNSVSSISLGHNELVFFEADNVAEEQVGYSINPGGQTLVTGKRGDWRENWLAIGYNELTGDVLIADMNKIVLTILIAQREEGDWRPTAIADSIDNLASIIGLLQNIAKDRGTPDELEDKPITDEERKQVLKEIATQNPRSELWYWESFLENE